MKYIKLDNDIINPYNDMLKEAAKELWQKELLPMGIRLMDKALTEVANGIYTKIPQRQDVDTFEPSTEVKDIYKPDLLMLPQSYEVIP